MEAAPPLAVDGHLGEKATDAQVRSGDRKCVPFAGQRSAAARSCELARTRARARARAHQRVHVEVADHPNLHPLPLFERREALLHVPGELNLLAIGLPYVHVVHRRRRVCNREEDVVHEPHLVREDEPAYRQNSTWEEEQRTRGGRRGQQKSLRGRALGLLKCWAQEKIAVAARDASSGRSRRPRHSKRGGLVGVAGPHLLRPCSV